VAARRVRQLDEVRHDWQNTVTTRLSRVLYANGGKQMKPVRLVMPRHGLTHATRRRAVLLVTAAAVATCLPAVAQMAPAAADTLPTWDTSKPCPTVLVIGARGTGQEDGNGGIPADSPTLGLGPEVYGFANHLASIVANKGKGTVAVWNNT
jgi:hypothetical protein